MQFPGVLVLLAAVVDPDAATSVAALEAEVERRASLGVEARVRFDDNLLRLQDGEATPLGRSRDDTRLTTSLVVDLATRASLQRFYVRGRAGYDFHRNNDFLDRERINLEGGVDWRLGTRCDGNVSLGYTRQQSNLEEIELVARNTRETEILTVQGGCNVGLAFRPELLIRERDSSNDEVLARRDLRASNYVLSLAYQRNELGTLRFSVFNEIFRYPNRPIAVLGLDDRVSAKGMSGRISRPLGARGRAVAAIGYTDVESRNPATRDYSGLNWLGSLSYAPVPRLRFAATGRRAIETSSDIAAGYFILDAADFAGRLRVGRAVDFELGAAAARRRFRGVDPLSTTARRRDRTLLLRGAVSYRPVDPVRLGLEIEHEKRTADISFAGFDSSRAIFSIAAAF